MPGRGRLVATVLACCLAAALGAAVVPPVPARAQTFATEQAWLAVRGGDDSLWMRRHPGGPWHDYGGTLGAPPAVVQSRAYGLVFLGVSPTHRLWVRTVLGGWRRLGQLDGRCTDVDAAVDAEDRLLVVCRGPSGRLYAAETPPASLRLSRWRPFVGPSGPAATGATVHVPPPIERVEEPDRTPVVLALGRPHSASGSNAYLTSWGVTPAWRPYGGVRCSAPPALALRHRTADPGQQRLDMDRVLCREPGGGIRWSTSYWEDAWLSAYERYGGGILGEDVVGRVAGFSPLDPYHDLPLTVYGVRRNGTIAAWRGDPGSFSPGSEWTWSGPEDLGGRAIGGIDAAGPVTTDDPPPQEATPDGVFPPTWIAARGSDDALWIKRYPAGPWRSFGGTLRAPPAMVLTRSHGVVVFAVGSDQRVWARTLLSPWRLVSADDLACRDVHAAVDGDERVTLTCLGADGRIAVARTAPFVLALDAWRDLGAPDVPASAGATALVPDGDPRTRPFLFTLGPEAAPVPGLVTEVYASPLPGGGWTAVQEHLAGAEPGAETRCASPPTVWRYEPGEEAALFCRDPQGRPAYALPAEGSETGGHGVSPGRMIGEVAVVDGGGRDRYGVVVVGPSRRVYAWVLHRDPASPSGWRATEMDDLGGQAIGGVAAL